MTAHTLPHRDPRVHHALAELQEIILRQYPAATFDIACAPDDPEETLLITTLDIDDANDLLDLVMDRVLDMQDEGIALHVIPESPPERIVAQLRQAGHLMGS